MGNRSTYIGKPNENAARSKLVKAMQGWTGPLDSYIAEPDGMFGRVAVFRCDDVTIRSNDLDLEFTVNFDDDLEANEAEVIVYNLSTDTIQKLKYKAWMSIEAGYKDDTGVIFRGYIDSISTTFDGADKITKIKCFDDILPMNKAVKSVTYKKNTKATYILRDLLDKVGLDIEVFNPRRDWTYKDETTVDGNLLENIKTYAEVCGISVYINQSKIYARHLWEGDNINFQVNEDTGMIGTPEFFTEESTAEDYTDIVNGYHVKMLLQHRMTTAALVTLNSRETVDTFRVRRGKHIFNESEAVTEIEVI